MTKAPYIICQINCNLKGEIPLFGNQQLVTDAVHKALLLLNSQ